MGAQLTIITIPAANGGWGGGVSSGEAMASPLPDGGQSKPWRDRLGDGLGLLPREQKDGFSPLDKYMQPLVSTAARDQWFGNTATQEERSRRVDSVSAELSSDIARELESLLGQLAEELLI